MGRTGATTLQRIRVPLGFLFGGVFLIFAKPTWPLIVFGFSVAMIGLVIRAWASGHIRKNSKLATSGPYAYTRNPLYLGSFILGLGFTIASGRWWLLLLLTVLFLGIYLRVMSVEADELKSIFGEEYRAYAVAVPLFFPGFGGSDDGSNKFELDLYLRYREYRAIVGLLVVFLILAAKAYFNL